MLKLARNELSFRFRDICNASFNDSVFPDKNIIAKVIPSHKKGLTNDVNKYRPISLVSTFCKIMEKLMAVRLTTYLELHEIIFPNLATHSLISITENIKRTFRWKKYDWVFS